MNARRQVRLRLWAISLGIAAALASTPAVAWADDLDFQISIDGYDLLPTTDNSATATSGVGDFAIAWGDGADANATGGFGDFAFADGAGSDATTFLNTSGNFDAAIANGEASYALADDGDFNVASAFGEFSNAQAGGIFGTPSSFDMASSSGPDSFAFAAYGNGDTALDVDPSDSVVNNTGSSAYAEGTSDFSSTFGDSSTAFAGGNNDIAAVFGTGDHADSGEPGNYDFAAIFDNNAYAETATNGNDLYDIVTALGNESGTAAATSGGWLAELLSLF